MVRAGPRRCAGFSFLELVLVIGIIGTLIGIAANRLVPYAAEAERVAVGRLEGQLRNVLMTEAALRISRGQAATLARLDGANPMALLLEPPGTYLGELNDPTREYLPLRSWHFNTADGRLVYRAGRGFEAPGGGPALLEYVTRVVFADTDGDGRFSPGADEFHGIRLLRVDGITSGI